MLEFRILGSLEVVEGARARPLGGIKQRAVLAVLLLNRREVVSTDRLIDAVWGERPPAGALKTLQVYVSHLRKLIGAELLITRGRGYVLEARREQVDLDRFEELAAEGHRALEAGASLEASRALSEALALWRGPPLEDLAYEPFAQAEAGALEGARLAALEDRVEADLELGRHSRLIRELETLVREHPLRERLHGQLMLALYRSGRQAEALGHYRRARGELVDQLGIEPGADLQQLERGILNQDPALAPPPRSARPMLPERPVRRGAALLVVGGVMLLAAAIVAAAIESDGTDTDVSPNSVAVIDLGSNEVTATVPVGVEPDLIDAEGTSVWVANSGDGTVSQVDVPERRLVATIATGSEISGLEAGEEGVWTTDLRHGVVARVDTALGRVDRKLELGVADLYGSGTGPIDAGAGAVWAGTSRSSFVRIDPRRVALEETVRVGNAPSSIAVGEGGVWVADQADDTVTRIDPATAGVLATTPVGREPAGIAAGEGGVWVAQPLDDTIARIDPRTNSVAATIPVGEAPKGVTVGAGSVWSANSGDGTVSRIDPRNGEVTATIEVGDSPQDAAVAGDSLWVTVQPPPSVPALEGDDADTVRVYPEARLRPGLPETDPALAVPSPVANATCAPLLGYPDLPFPAGARLRPELARSMPAVSDGGRTYTYRLRDGFRFSPPRDQPVTAAAFRRAIERSLDPRMGSFAPELLGDIAGFDAYTSGRAEHLAGVTAKGDQLAITLAAPSPSLPARLTSPTVCPVPPNTPVDPAGIDSIPSAGPYYVASSSGQDGIVLLRNPGYGGDRPANFEEIDVLPPVAQPEAIDEVEAGRADVLDLAPDEQGAARIESAYGPSGSSEDTEAPRYVSSPTTVIHYLALNTKRPLFSGARMRRAINYAIDRRSLAREPDSGVFGKPTDQYIPPGMRGFRDELVYPLGGPDLATAKRLVGNLSRRAVMYTCNDPVCRRNAGVVSADLAPLGIDVRVRQFSLDELIGKLIGPAQSGAPGRWDIAETAWFADYADPYDIVNVLFEFVPGLSSGNVNLGQFDQQPFQRQMRRAASLSGPSRYLTYAGLDGDLAREAAPAVAFANGTTNYFFSERVGCQIVNASYGLDLPALCPRP